MTKHYDISGVGSTLQFGKGGALIKTATADLAARNTTDDAYVNFSVAEPSNDEHAATKYYVDAAISGVSIGSMITAIRSVVTANNTDDSFTIGAIPSPDGLLVYVSRIILDVATIFAGGSVAVAEITDGTTTLMTINQNDILTQESYAVDLPFEVDSTGSNIVINFFEIDGITSSIPVTGECNITVMFALI